MTRGFDIAVCIILKNGCPWIETSLPRILTQRIDAPFEVIVVDSGSSDGSVEFVQRLCSESDNVRLICIAPSDFHHAKTRNFAAGVSQARFRVFLNGDAVPADGQWLERLTAPVMSGAAGIALSYSRQRSRADVDTNNGCRIAFNYGPQSLVKSNEMQLTPKQRHMFSSVSCCVDTEVLGSPLFRDDIPVNEDVALAAQALRDGLKVAYCADSVVLHSHNLGYLEILRRSFDNAVVFQRLAIFDEHGPGVGRDGLDYLGASLLGLQHRGVAAKTRFMLFFACTAVGALLGKHYLKLPRRLAKHLSIYGTV